MMKYVINIFIILTIAIQFSCIEKKDSFKEITMISKKELISVKESAKIISLQEKDFVLLDIRTKKEYDLFHIKGAINIDYYDPNFKNNINNFDKKKKYLIYCRTAHRTIDGLSIMKKLGFKVSHMEGGITNWIKNGYVVVKN